MEEGKNWNKRHHISSILSEEDEETLLMEMHPVSSLAWTSSYILAGYYYI